MRTIADATGLSDVTTTLARLWTITRRDGTILRFTDHDQDITASGDLYSSAVGYTASVIEDSADSSVDTAEIFAFLDSTAITRQDLEAGLFNNARVDIVQVNYLLPDTSTFNEKRGFLGNVTIQDNDLTIEFRGLHQILQQPIGERYSNICTAILGDSRCQVRLVPDDWTLSTVVTAVTDYDAGTGSVVADTAGGNDLQFKCTTGGTTNTTEPTWPTVVGGTVSDNGVVWEAIQALSFDSAISTANDAYLYWRINISGTGGGNAVLTEINFRMLPGASRLSQYLDYDPSESLSSATYSDAEVNDVFTIGNTTNTSVGIGELPTHLVVEFSTTQAIGAYYIRSNAGSDFNQLGDWTLEGSADGSIWNVVDTQTSQELVLDNTGIATEYTLASSIPVANIHYFAIDNLGDFPDGWFNGGLITFNSGDNIGVSREIKRQVGSVVEIYDRLPETPLATDTVTIKAGCAKTKAACRDKFSNTYNNRGFFNIPGIDKATRYPNANG